MLQAAEHYQMFILKGCPKCKGDLVAETSIRRMSLNADVVCIQCGYSLQLDEQSDLSQRSAPQSTFMRLSAARPNRAHAQLQSRR